MKFLLINPTAEPWRVLPGVPPRPSTQIFRFSMLTSLSVAAALPPDVEVQIVDEEVEPIDPGSDADLVGISFMTFNAPRAYKIADFFREKGKKVVVGGYHPTFMPDEALRHADAVCIGEAEPIMADLIADFRNGRLKQRYQTGLADLSGLKTPDRRLLRRRSSYALDAVMATRGCPNSCAFCSIPPFFRNTFRTRPVADVVEELRGLGRHVLFMDDNLTASREYARELFAAMVPLRKLWFCQSSIRIACDAGLLRLMHQSGCRGLFIGLESLKQGNLDNWGKPFGKTAEYRAAVERIHREGMGICAGLVFGHDGDEESVFDDALRFLSEVNMDVFQATILTPFPGTPLFSELQRAGRILTPDWTQYDFCHVVFEPRGMSREALRAGHDRVLKEFYSRRSILRRACRELSYLDLSTVLKATVPVNLGYRSRLTSYGTCRL